ncbi:hypothetical protein RKD27_000742 [Streptomyces sp. SAI-126]
MARRGRGAGRAEHGRHGAGPRPGRDHRTDGLRHGCRTLARRCREPGLRQGAHPHERHVHDPERRQEPQLHPEGPGRLRPQPPPPAGLRVPLAGRHLHRRLHRPHGGNRHLGLLRAPATGEQQHRLRRTAGPQQRLGQLRWGGRHLRRRHDPADRGGPVRRHHPALRPRLQLRRRHVVRPRLYPCDGLPRGRGAERRAAQRMQRWHPAHRLPRSARPQGQRARHLRRADDAGQVRPEQRLHPPEPARARPGQPDAPGHHLLGLLGRASGRLGGLRRGTHRRSPGRSPR